MEPLSQRRRIFYLVLLIATFVVLVPITLLYSSGYRLGDGFSLVKTGGVYVGLSESKAELFLDGKLVKEAGILKNGFFIQDLTPRVYHIIVKKEGYRSWEKVLEVLPQRVSEASAFILPNTIPYVEIPSLDASYSEIVDMFATSTDTLINPDEYPITLATSTRTQSVEDVKRKGDVILWREGETVYAQWVNKNSNAPSYFCSDGACNREIILNKKPVQYFDFHPDSNELVLFVIDDVLVMTEIDPRIPRNEQSLFKAHGVEFRTRGSSILVKEPTAEGEIFFEFEL